MHMMFLWVAYKLKLDLAACECEAEGFVKQYFDNKEDLTHVIMRPKITVFCDDGARSACP